MRVALLGWDLDREGAERLGALGPEVVAFTRWFAGEPTREAHRGWLEVRCPHEIGGDARDEARSFGVAVIREASNLGLAVDFDVVHALDPRARVAAGELASRYPDAVLAASATAADDASDDPGFGPVAAPDAWLCDHPWRAELLRAQVEDPSTVLVVSTSAGLTYWSESGTPDLDPNPVGPLALFALHADSRISTRAAVEGVRLARDKAPELSAAVFGFGPRAERLRRRLAREGLLSPRWGRTTRPTCGRWGAAAARAAVVAVGSAEPVDDPFALASWMVGTPVVRVANDDARALGRALVDALFDPARRESDVLAGAALQERKLSPEGVADERLRAYFRSLDRKRAASAPVAARRKAEPGEMPFPELRSRLALTPIGSRQVLASWRVRPDDWRDALQWLGPESVRATLAIRIFDVTDVVYDGLNAHSSFDVDLGVGETSRAIGLPYDGRALAACLGVRSRWGYFHPLAHARICHLPREGVAPFSEPRRLRVLPRRPGP